MWSIVRKLSGILFRIFLAFFLVGFGFFVYFTLTSEELNQNQQILTSISLIAVILSIPGIINTFAEELNPKRKKYKLSCKCPKCKHLIQMDMVEE